MNIKKQPQRTCLGCGQQRDKKAMIRIVRSPEGQYMMDESGRKNGRGAYVCRDISCLQTAIRKKALSRSFREQIPEAVYEQLTEEMEKLV